jgi:hypothetical protein
LAATGIVMHAMHVPATTPMPVHELAALPTDGEMRGLGQRAMASAAVGARAKAQVNGADPHPPLVSPPITCNTVPVMYDESAFDARNTYAGASSSGCAGRFIGLSLPEVRDLLLVRSASDGLSGVHHGAGRDGVDADALVDHVHRERLRERV